MTRTLQQLAAEAVVIQDACNPLGLSSTYARVVQELHERLRLDDQPNDTSAMCLHPINQLWASKLHDLACMGMSDTEQYGIAYGKCKELAAGNQPKGPVNES